MQLKLQPTELNVAVQYVNHYATETSLGLVSIEMLRLCYLTFRQKLPVKKYYNAFQIESDLFR